jgi:molybdenum cofactor synthesis domain-containing protein
VAGCSLVVTTGGTGPAPRDVTPEATAAVCSRMMPGYGEQMRAISLKYVPTAVLSRQVRVSRACAQELLCVVLATCKSQRNGSVTCMLNIHVANSVLT